LGKTVEFQSAEQELGNSEKQKAVEKLEELGLLVSFSEVETFHGYTKPIGKPDDWSVLTAEKYKEKLMSNARNAEVASWLQDMYIKSVDSGNNNAFNTFCLYTATESDAGGFADARLLENAEDNRQKLLGDLVRKTDAGKFFQSVRDADNALILESKWGNHKTDSRQVRSEWPDDNRGYEMGLALRKYESTMDQQQLLELEEEAVRLSNLEAVVVEIVARNAGAMLYDFRAPLQDGEEATQQASGVLESATPEYVHFLDDEILESRQAHHVQSALTKIDGEFATESIVQAIVADLGVPESEVRMITEAYNSRKLFLENTRSAVYGVLASDNGGYFIPKALREDEVRCSKDFVLKTLKELGVVGVINDQESATTRDMIHSMVTIFDLESVKRK